MTFSNLRAWEIAQGYKNKDFSCQEVTREFLDNIKEKDGEINAYITVTEDMAMKKAKEVDEKFHNREEVSPLAGVPISIKDNISVKDVKMTCASRMLENYTAPYDATLVKKIKNNDGVILGKVNMDEFAMGASTRTSYFGVTKNPLDTTRVSGGSSGGSAASVSADMAAISIGSDTGGSVRQPSSFCKTVGMKPTYGSISRFGMASMANTFDQPGVIAKDVRDLTMMFNVIEGRDERDATSVGNPGLKYDFDFSDDAIKNLEGKKFAIPKTYLDMDLNDRVRGELDKAIEVLKDNGAVVEAYDIDSLNHTIETYNILVNGEIASNLARFDSIRYGHRTDKKFDTIEEMYRASRQEGFGEEVKRRIMIGTHILSMENADEFYYKALKVRGLIKRDMDRMFKDYDFMICPTFPVLPFKIDDDMTPVEMYQADLFTIPANMVGSPSISLPMPAGEDGLSVGIEFTAKRFKDKDLLQASLAFERSLNKWNIKQL